MFKKLLIAFALLAVPIAGEAAVVSGSFTATNFIALDPGTPADAQGVFSLDVDQQTLQVGLTGFDAIIGGTTYTLTDVGLQPLGGSLFLLGSSAPGIGNVIPGTPSFYLLFDVSPLALTVSTASQFNSTFVYADTVGGEFAALDTEVTTVSPGSVPEPASWLMMLIGFAVVGGRIRRANFQELRRVGFKQNVGGRK
jgi:hypothetical protein